MKKRMLGLLAALALCLGLLPGTAWAEEETENGGDITTTGMDFYSPYGKTPMEKTIYRAGDGTVTWIPTVEGEGEEKKITHGTFIFENTTFHLASGRSVLRYITDARKGVDSDIEVILKGENVVTAQHYSSSIFSFGHNADTDSWPKLTIIGESGGSLTYTNTAEDGPQYGAAFLAIRGTGAINIKDVTLNLQKGGILTEEDDSPICIENSTIDISLKGTGIPSFTHAIRAYRNTSSISVVNSTVSIDSDVSGIDAETCIFKNSEVTVKTPFSVSTSPKPLYANKMDLENSKLTLCGGCSGFAGINKFPDNSQAWHELQNKIHVAGKLSVSPTASEKQLLVRENAALSIENDASFDVVLYDGAAFTASNAKSLTGNGSGKIVLDDEIPAMTVSGSITTQYPLTLEYTGTTPKSPVVLAAKTAEDAEKITFDTDKFERKENQIVWKQTPLAAPTDLSWNGAKAQWGAVENAQGYTVQLYKDGETYGEPVTVTSAAEYDFTDFLTETGSYTFTVKAMGGDSILHADSEYSEASGEFDYIAPERFTVSFDAQGGTAVAGQTVVDGETVSKPSAPTRSGYIFGGWFTNADCSSAYDFSAPVTGDLTLYAKWTPKPADPPPAAKTHTVRFLDGGTELASHTVQEGSKAAPPDEPVKRGYRFAGWHTDPEGTEAFDFETPVTGDLTLYAKWTALPGGEDVPFGGGSSGRDDDDDEPRPPATAATTITQNPDGSTTKTTTDRRTGAVTTVTTAPDGTSVTVVADQNGHVVSTEASVPKGAAVLPTAPEGEVKITVKGGGRAEVTLPAESAGPGVVAVLVSPEGTKTVVRKSILTENGVVLTVQGSAVVRLEDRGRIFPDVPEGWKAEAAAFVSAREILNGGTDGLFRPDTPMTRATLTVALHNLEGNPLHGTAAAFLDVPEHAWYAEAVSWASARGIVTGYTDEIFGPGDRITREQLAVMLWRAAGRPAPSSRVLPFPDADQAADYAMEALCWAVERGIIHGGSDGTLAPKGLATRAQTAQMLKNFLENG